MITVGVVGTGQWGPNHIRIFGELPDSRAVICCDTDAARLDAVAALFPAIATTTVYDDILENKDIDAVCVAANTGAHFELAARALEAGKHVLCEKPLALTTAQCRSLGELARSRNLILMVGHIFLFNPGIVRLREYVGAGELGNIFYAHSRRTNLGPFRYDVNALWDLAPHDIAIFNYLFDAVPVSVSARGLKCLGQSHEDLAFATLDYPGNMMVNVHVSWLDPLKVRQITVVGDKKMIVWDDLDSTGPLRLFDKHVERTSVFYETYGEFQLLSREGNVTVSNVPSLEPLKAQNGYFIDCIRNAEPPLLADAEKGREVVMTLCAIQESMTRGGAQVPTADFA